jgi:hypothetical protein
MKRFYFGLWVALWAIGLGSLYVSGNIQSDILTNNQNTQASATYPVKIELKGKEFNVTRRQKYVYESANAVTLAVAPLMIVVFVVWRRSKNREVSASA